MIFRSAILFQIILVVFKNIEKIHSQEFGLIGDALEAYAPCDNGVLGMERLIGGPPDKENYWDGTVFLDKYKNLPEARLVIKLDAPANITVDENDGRINTLKDSFHIGYYKKDGGFQTVKFRVNGVPRGKFPNVESLILNGVNICPNVSKWTPSILGPSSQGSLITDKDLQGSTLIKNITSSTLLQSCGRRLIQHQGLITNGYPSKEGDWPWHAGIYHQISSTNFEYKCGGTLISRNAILTASHCVIENGRFLIASRILVKLGQHNRLVAGRNTQEFQVHRIVPHFEFGFDDFKNDIAILKLATEPTLSQYVQPACLWPQDDTSIQSLIGKNGFVVGWGYNTENKLSDILIQAQIPIISITDCLESNRDFFGAFLSDNNYCAGFRNGTNVCNGDSGGGMFFFKDNQYYIRGLVSLSVSKITEQICDSKQYVVFTDVAKYLNWIEVNLL